MKDYVLREIDKMGKLIEAILLKIGILKSENRKDELIEATKIELIKNLDIDIDKLFENENFIEILIQEYRFNTNDLEKFAELLFDFVEATDNMDEKNDLICRIGKIYTYLEKEEHPISFKMFEILTELKKYTVIKL